MNRIIIFLLLFLFSQANVFSQFKTKPGVAVLSIIPGEMRQDTRYLSNCLCNAIVNCGCYNVREQNHVNQILKELKLSQWGFISDEDAIRIGKMLTVRYIIKGEFGKRDNSYWLYLRMIDIGTGKIIFHDKNDWKGEDNKVVDDAIKFLVCRLAKEVNRFRCPYSFKDKKAWWYSLLIPGWGQTRLGHTGRAIFFPMLEIAAIGGLFWTNKQYNAHVADYNCLVSKYSDSFPQSEINDVYCRMEKKYDQLLKANEKRKTILGLAAGIWLYNVVDAAIFNNKQNKVSSNSGLINSNIFLCQGHDQIRIGIMFRY